MTLDWRTRWTDFIRIRSSELAAAIFIRQHVLRWPPLTSTRDRGNNGQSIAAASRRESEKRLGTGDGRSTGDVKARATSRGAADSDKCWNCQVSVRANGRPTGRQTMLHLPGSRRRASGHATNVRRPHDRMDEFYYYSDGSSTVRSRKQWYGIRAVGRPKTDGDSLVRSENTAGGNRPSIEPSHGRFVACHNINFHIKPEKGVDLHEGLAFFLHLGVKIWGSTYMCSRFVRDYIR